MMGLTGGRADEYGRRLLGATLFVKGQQKTYESLHPYIKQVMFRKPSSNISSRILLLVLLHWSEHRIPTCI